MSTIPVSLTQDQFEQYLCPYLSVANRGYECRIPLYQVFNYILYRLHTGCQWARLPIANDPDDPTNKISATLPSTITTASGAAMAAWTGYLSMASSREQIDIHHLNLDGSHAPAKKGDEAVAYQGRKKAKTSHVLPSRTPMVSSWQPRASSRATTTMPSS